MDVTRKCAAHRIPRCLHRVRGEKRVARFNLNPPYRIRASTSRFLGPRLGKWTLDQGHHLESSIRRTRMDPRACGSWDARHRKLFLLRPHLGIVTNGPGVPRRAGTTARGRLCCPASGSVATGIWPNHVVTPAIERKTDGKSDLRWISRAPGSQCRWETVIGRGETGADCEGIRPSARKALLLDEPTASLDFRAVRELREILRKITAAGTSMILVTHHLEDIIPEIQRVVILKWWSASCATVLKQTF